MASTKARLLKHDLPVHGKTLGEFRRRFSGVFFWVPFFLVKNRTKNPPQNPQQNSNQNLGVSRRKSTLQGSGLDNCGHVWTIEDEYPKPPFESCHSDFPEEEPHLLRWLLANFPPLSGTKRRFSFWRWFCKIYASLGCGFPSAKCTPGPIVLVYFLFLGCDALDSVENALC